MILVTKMYFLFIMIRNNVLDFITILTIINLVEWANSHRLYCSVQTCIVQLYIYVCCTKVVRLSEWTFEAGGWGFVRLNDRVVKSIAVTFALVSIRDQCRFMTGYRKLYVYSDLLVFAVLRRGGWGEKGFFLGVIKIIKWPISKYVW